MGNAAHEDTLVSVLMPAFNAAGTITAAIDSVLSQTLAALRLVVVDDGSTDGTAEIVAGIAERDERVSVLSRRENRGLVYSLQEGLEALTTPLVARLDADDWSHPTRLERQVKVFDDIEVVLSATGYRRVRPDGTTIRVAHPPRTHAALAAALVNGNRLCHSSVMFRANAVQSVGGYRASWYPVEDYDLWLRLPSFGRFAGVADVLVDYVDHPEGVSARRADEQRTLLELRRDQYRTGLLGSPIDPLGNPTAVVWLRRALALDLSERSIPLDGLDEECFRQAMAGNAPTWARRARLLTHPSLLWRAQR